MKIEINNIVLNVVFLILIIGISAFTYSKFKNKKANIFPAKEKIYEYYQVDEIPKFQGDNSRIDSVLYSNLKWIDSGSFVDGRVIISYIITNEGDIKNVKVEKKLCQQCDENAIEAFNNLTNWQPGVKHGIPVNTRMYLPISFVIWE